MSYNHGIPFKIAIEAKKYKPTNPISVELVRSFVGANQMIKANKLIYVTTSYFTKDARDFAFCSGNTNLLELKELKDIVDWSNQYKKIIT